MFDEPAFLIILAELTSRSEWDLLRQHRILGIVAGILFVLGLISYRWILPRLWRSHVLPNRVGPKPWGAPELLMAFGAYLWGQLVVQVILSRSQGELESLWKQTLVGHLLLNTALLIALAVYFRARHIRWADAFGQGPQGVPIGLWGYVAVWPPVLLSFALMQAVYHQLDWPIAPQPLATLFVETRSPSILVLVTLLAVVTAPIFEEVMFRGLLYPFLKQRLGQTAATLVVSALFAVVHFHLPSMLPLFVLGVALVLVYEASDSVTASITLHAAFNAANLLMLAYVRTQS
ncbi:MAG: type II CAAX endopeptidase family protein [Verrucomicrobiae bacterium]|nr:type II CAAX endopeptidase family protein [Verrucomicrobiae bacterium]